MSNGFLHDERGSRSSARALTWLVLLATVALIFLDARSVAFTVPDAAWVLLGTIASGLILWAAGPRIAQHAAPMLAKGIDALRDVVYKRRDPELGVEVTK